MQHAAGKQSLGTGAYHNQNRWGYRGHKDRYYQKALKKGDRLKLLLEPKNKYDEKAILVLDPKGKKLGYIPRVKNEVLYHLMDAGKELFGIVHGGDIGDHLDERDSWIEIYIDVYMCD